MKINKTTSDQGKITIFKDISDLIALLITKLFGKNVTWEGRSVCQKTFTLLSKASWTPAELSQLEQLLVHSIEHKQDSHFWQSRIHQGSPSHLKNCFDKILKSLDYIESISENEILQHTTTLSDLESKEAYLIGVDLKVRCFAFSALKFNEAYRDLSNIGISLTNSSRFTKASEHFNQAAENSTKLAERTLKNYPWNPRQIFFQATERDRILHVNKMGYMDRFFHLTNTRFNHSGMILPNGKSPEQRHMGWSDFESDPLSLSALLSSEIVELDAKNLLKPADIDLLKTKMNKNEDEVIQTVNTMLEESIQRSHQNAAPLKLKNKMNPIRVASAKIFNFLWKRTDTMKRISNFQKNQWIHCSEYVSLTLYRAIEEVNDKLSKNFGDKAGLLHTPFQTNILPSALRPDDLFEIINRRI